MYERRTIVRAAQRLIAMLLLVCVGAAPTLAQLLRPVQAKCAMSCCKRKLDPHCCKRHLHVAGSVKGPFLKSDSACSKTCGFPALAPITVAFELSKLKLAAPKGHEDRILPQARAPGARASFNKLLLQRPPPSLLLPQTSAA
jgi:hypothetical protein